MKFCSKICYDDNRPTSKADSDFRRKEKRSAISKEQTLAVCGMYDPLITELENDNR